MKYDVFALESNIWSVISTVLLKPKVFTRPCSHVHGKSGNIAERVQARDAVTTDH